MRMVATLEEYKSVAFSLNKTLIQCFVFMKGNNTSVLNYTKLCCFDDVRSGRSLIFNFQKREVH